MHQRLREVESQCAVYVANALSAVAYMQEVAYIALSGIFQKLQSLCLLLMQRCCRKRFHRTAKRHSFG